MTSRPGPFFSSSVRALVVDRDPTEAENVRDCFLRAFGAEGTTVEIVASIREARAQIRDASYDVLIVDYACALSEAADGLPEVDGVPVILLAGSRHEEVGRRAIEAGMTNIIVKSALAPERFFEAMNGG
jgi:CheY-like chemotaxis protein